MCVQVGKGRQISGIIADNLARGRGQHVWLSTSSDLRLDAQRDLQDLGIHCKVIDGCQDLDLNTKALGLGSEFKEGGRVCVHVRKHLHAHTNERAHTHMHHRTKPLVFPSLFPLSFLIFCPFSFRSQALCCLIPRNTVVHNARTHT